MTINRYYSSVAPNNVNDALDEQWKHNNTKLGGQDAWLKVAEKSVKKIVRLLKDLDKVEDPQEKVQKVKSELDPKTYPTDKAGMNLAEALFLFSAQERFAIARQLGHKEGYGIPRTAGRSSPLSQNKWESQWPDMKEIIIKNKDEFSEIRDKKDHIIGIKLGKEEYASTLIINKKREKKGKVSYLQINDKGKTKERKLDIWDHINNGSRGFLRIDYPKPNGNQFEEANKSLERVLGKKKQKKEKTLNKIGETAYNLLKPIGLNQGSASAVEFLFSALLVHKNLTVPQRKKGGVGWDVRALLLPNKKEFTSYFRGGLFAEKPKRIQARNKNPSNISPVTEEGIVAVADIEKNNNSPEILEDAVKRVREAGDSESGYVSQVNETILKQKNGNKPYSFERLNYTKLDKETNNSLKTTTKGDVEVLSPKEIQFILKKSEERKSVKDTSSTKAFVSTDKKKKHSKEKKGALSYTTNNRNDRFTQKVKKKRNKETTRIR